MQILFLSNSLGGSGRLRLSWASAFGTVMVLAMVGTALVYAGARWGAAVASEKMLAQAHADARAEEPRWQREVEAQRKDLAQLNEAIELNVNALAMRLGEMQAHVARVDALGERVATMAHLSKGEFDFASTPATGGPAAGSPVVSDVGDIAAAFTRLSREIDDRTEKLNALETMLLNRDLQEQISPEGTPLLSGWMSSGYGKRVDPLTGRREFHTGVDFTGSLNSKVIALAAGVVSFSAVRNEYGNVVEVNHGNGTVTRYAHNKENLVKVGDKVKKGQEIAIMGTTGRTTGAHVHFEVLQDGNIVNPVDYIRSANDDLRNAQRQGS